MKITTALNVISDFKIKDKLHIHPNDGFDIDLINVSYKVKIVSILSNEQENFEGEIVLDNKCKHGNILMGVPLWQRLNKPPQVKVSISDDKSTLFITK